jgi:hypothetical protein
VTVALAEHLLGKLAHGDSCSIDNKMKLKGPCQCGCDMMPHFNSTGIGIKQSFEFILINLLNINHTYFSLATPCYQEHSGSWIFRGSHLYIPMLIAEKTHEIVQISI